MIETVLTGESLYTKAKDELSSLIINTVPRDGRGGNVMPLNKSSNLNVGIPTPETSWNKNQYQNQNKSFVTTSYKLGPYSLWEQIY